MLTNLLTNFHKMTHSGKESYFGKRWGATSAFQKQFSREQYKFDEVSKSAPTIQLRDQILNAYQNQPKEEHRDFVNRLREQSLSFLAERRGLQLQQMERLASLNESMTCLLRNIFDVIECFSMELNCYVGCTELQTSATRPQHVLEIMKYSLSRQPLEAVTYFRARLASPSWSLVVRGKDGRIEMFLIPVGRVMGLSKSEAAYQPLAVLEATLDETTNAVSWSFEGRPLSSQCMQELCKQMFASLIETTQYQLQVDQQWLANRPYAG
jgi:hypothetical protein